jgi:hypothetical protein
MNIADLVLIHVLNLSVETLNDVLGMQIIQGVQSLVVVAVHNLI